MAAFNWEQAKQARRAALQQVPVDARARRLLAELKKEGFLRSHVLGSEDDLYRYTVGEIARWGSIEPFRVLTFAGDTVSLVIEGDYYEDGSYAREMKRFFDMTDGDIVATNVRDDLHANVQEVRVMFDWLGETHELRSRAPDPISDYFDSGILRELNRILRERGLPRRFVSFLDVEVQFCGWLYLDPARRVELQFRNLLIFDERIPYSVDALPFLW